MRLYPLRENLTLPNEDREGSPEESWDHLTIYDDKGRVLKRSTRHHPEGEIRLEFEGIEFVANRQGEILVTFQSILKVI